MPASVSTATGRPFVGGALSRRELHAGAIVPDLAGPVPATLTGPWSPPVVVRQIPDPPAKPSVTSGAVRSSVLLAQAASSGSALLHPGTADVVPRR